MVATTRSPRRAMGSGLLPCQRPERADLYAGSEGQGGHEDIDVNKYIVWQRACQMEQVDRGMSRMP